MTATRVTGEQLWMMPQNGHRYELIAGVLRETSAVGGVHGQLRAVMVGALCAWNREHRAGVVIGTGTGFYLFHEPDTVRTPDAAFLTHANWQAQPRPEAFLEGAPDLAVEVVSPNDRAEDVQEKALMWLDAGARLVWIIEPRTRSATEYLPGGAARVLRVTDVLAGGAVLPGFALRLKELFEEL